MFLTQSILSKMRSFTLIIALITISLFTVGGCNDDNNGNGLGGELDTSQCEVLPDPCSTVSEITTENATYAECIIKDTTCVFNIDNFLTQIKNNGFNVTENSSLWIGAWGGAGGLAKNDGGNGGAAGYAQFTSTVSDIKNTFNETGDIFYFLGENGGDGPNHCGGGGGASTILSIEDLSLSPSTDPDSGSIVMIAGGGGGASGGRIPGCITPTGFDGAPGGIAISGDSEDKTDQGTGCQNVDFNDCGSTTCGDCIGSEGGPFVAEGGSGNTSCTAGTACGGQLTCCAKNQTEPSNGNDGFGGKGGKGGKGVNCTQTGNAGFKNVTGFSFDAGQGGDAGGGDAACVNGGGGGGGGVGGGGSGGHGNDDTSAQSGGGGGSFSLQSNQSSSTVPSSRPDNACGSDAGGCLVINIIED